MPKLIVTSLMFYSLLSGGQVWAHAQRGVNSLFQDLKKLDSANALQTEAFESKLNCLSETQRQQLRAQIGQWLKSDQTKEQLLALKMLKYFKAPSFVSVIKSKLKHDNPDIHYQAAQILGQIENPSVTQVLLDALKDPNPSVRDAALWALSNSEAPEIAAVITDIFQNDTNPKVRATAAFLMGAHPQQSTPTLLISVLQAPHEELRFNVVSALAQIYEFHSEDRSLSEALLTALGDKSERVRLTAIEALTVRAEPTATQALLTTLQDPKASVRAAAVEALGEIWKQAHIGKDPIKNQAVTQALIKRLNDEHEEVRQKAVMALGLIEEQSAVSALTAKLNTQSLETQLLTIDALGQISNVSSLPTLIQLLEDPHPKIRSQALVALSMSGIDLISLDMPILNGTHEELREREAMMQSLQTLAQKIQHHDPQVRAATAQALALWQSEATAELLMAALQDSQPDVRAQAARSLGQLSLSNTGASNSKFPQMKKTQTALLTLLQDENVKVKLAAVKALGALTRNIKYIIVSESESVDFQLNREAYLLVLQDDNEAVRRQASSLLPFELRASVRKDFIQALRSSDKKSRTTAIRGLNDLYDHEAAQAILKALQDSPYPDMRMEAALTLENNLLLEPTLTQSILNHLEQAAQNDPDAELRRLFEQLLYSAKQSSRIENEVENEMENETSGDPSRCVNSEAKAPMA